MRKLTVKEVHELPEGTRVRVLWSGGNTHYWYTVKKLLGDSFFCTQTQQESLVGFPEEAESMEVRE